MRAIRRGLACLALGLFVAVGAAGCGGEDQDSLTHLKPTDAQVPVVARKVGFTQGRGGTGRAVRRVDCHVQQDLGLAEIAKPGDTDGFNCLVVYKYAPAMPCYTPGLMSNGQLEQQMCVPPAGTDDYDECLERAVRTVCDAEARREIASCAGQVEVVGAPPAAERRMARVQRRSCRGEVYTDTGHGLRNFVGGIYHEPDPTPTPAEAELALAKASSNGPSDRPRVVCARPPSDTQSIPRWTCLVTYSANDLEQCGVNEPAANGHLPDPISCQPLTHAGQWYASCKSRHDLAACQRLGKQWTKRCVQRPAIRRACELEVYGRAQPSA